VESPELTEVEASRETKDVPLAAIRGIIHAAGGENIAYSTSIQSLYITLTQEYTAKAKNKDTGVYGFTAEAKANTDSLVARLTSVFEEYGDPSAKKLLQEDILALLDLDFKKSLGYVPRKIKTGLTAKEVAHFMENKESYPGVSVVEESIRHYDKDTVAVQTVGYMKLFRSTEDYDIYKNIRNAMKQTGADLCVLRAERQYTALQLAQYTATLANEGERIKPQLVSRITDAEGHTVKEFGREVLDRITFDPSYWKEIKQGMNTSVKVFDGFPYDFARKTGTSEMDA
jgi:cell division protein FtsI/penicillin-binding protein 2